MPPVRPLSAMRSAEPARTGDHEWNIAMAQKNLLGKLALVLALAMAFLVPLMMVQSLVAERAGLKADVVRDIARTAADRQRIVLPLLVVPYTLSQTEEKETLDEAGNRRVVRTEKTTEGAVRLLPDSTGVTTAPVLSEKHRGLYRVLTWNSTLAMSGRFTLPAQFGLNAKGRVSWGTPHFVLGLSDPRGLVGQPTLTWNDRNVAMVPGSVDAWSRVGRGISAALTDLPHEGGSMEFRLRVELSGMESLSFVPTARDSSVTVAAAWPHPGFFGRFSPDSTIDADRFSARWRQNLFATGVEQAYADCGEKGKCEAFLGNEFGVSFVQPVDLYRQLERSTKYGFLFVGLTFAAFFFIETLRSLAMHPIQYGLVGMALALFFVVLVAAAEHIGFVPAYVVAAGACVSLIVAYLWAALASPRIAAAVGALLASLYAVMFGLLRSEDHALLAGALFLFGLLAAVMLGTRRVNWYALSRPTAGGAG
ncbi:MAG: cell envelope integrity protein CreD [Burkholderiales bacterium]